MPTRLIALLALIPLTALAAHVQAPPEPKFKSQTIDDKIQIGYGVAVADVDGDRKPDILLADKKQLVWYRNPTWEKFVIASDLTPRDNVCLAAQDIDGDGKCELAVGADWDPNDREHSGAVFYLIAPKDRTQKWEPVKLPAEPTVHRMRWMQLADKTWALVVAPLHGRGKEGTAGSKILMYRVPADVRQEWKTAVLEDAMHATHNFDIHPEGGDRRFLIAGKEGVRQLYKSANETSWSKSWEVSKEHFDKFPGAGEVRFGRLKFATYLATVEPMHGNQLCVYEASSEPCGSVVERVVLTDKLIEGHALACADLLGAGSDQIVVGWRGGKGGIHLFTSLYDSQNSAWRESVIADSGMACEDLCVADLNGDGKPDIVASGRGTHNVIIYFNATGSP